MEGLKDVLIFVAGFALAWIILRFIAIKWRDNAKTDRKILKQVQDDATIRKEANKQKIVSALQSQDQITNDEVQKLLGVSDATATRYLDELEKEGHIRQVGKTGRQVYYMRN